MDIKSIGDRVDFNSLTDQPLDSPTLDDLLLLEKALTSMAYIILGCLLVMDTGQKTEVARPSSSITLGSIIGLGIEGILKQFSLVWFLDNLPYILDNSVNELDDVVIISKSFLNDQMSSIMRILGGMVSHPEVRSSLIKDLDDLPVSSEAFLNLKSIDVILYHRICEWLDYGIKHPENMNMPIFIITDGINMFRVVSHWIAWVCIMQEENGWSRHCKKSIKSLSQLMYKSIKDGQLSVSSFFCM